MYSRNLDPGLLTPRSTGVRGVASHPLEDKLWAKPGPGYKRHEEMALTPAAIQGGQGDKTIPPKSRAQRAVQRKSQVVKREPRPGCKQVLELLPSHICFNDNVLDKHILVEEARGSRSAMDPGSTVDQSRYELGHGTAPPTCLPASVSTCVQWV